MTSLYLHRIERRNGVWLGPRFDRALERRG